MLLLLAPILAVFVLALVFAPTDPAGPLDPDTLRRRMEEEWARRERAARRLSIAIQVFALAMLVVGIAGLIHFGIGHPSGTAEQRLSQFIGDVPGLITAGTLVVFSVMLYVHYAFPLC